jgi:4-aminobutyrate aminotransferase
MSQATNYLAPVWTHLTDIEPVRGEGAYLYDADGNAYLDFTCGIGVTNTGHNHPHVVNAIKEQADKLIFGQMNIVMNPQFAQLAEALNAITPPRIDRFFFSNSGAEATEAAVKLARHATGKTNIIVFQGSFHGRTAQTMAMTTSKTIYRHKYQPLPGGIFVAPFPASYYYGMSDDEATDFAMKQLTYLIKGQTSPDETAAIIIEPVLGEGGYIPAPDGFLQALREFATQHDILLVLDEVQSGFGRTGKIFAFEHADIEPDIIIMAKGLGSGMPISGIASRADLMEKWVAGSHGGTYGGGNAIVGAAARATVEVMQKENLPDNASRMGERLMDGLRDLQAEFPIIGDVRGRGLMVATEFTHPDGTPAPDITKQIIQGVLERNLLMLSCGTFSNVVRWIPPLIVSETDIDKALDIFAQALRNVSY